MFHIINKNTGLVVGKAKSMVSARKDLAYGGYIHMIKPA